jgi:HK97 gp10 family phage protein
VAKVTVKILGFEQLKKNISRLISDLDGEGKQTLTAEADRLVRVMRQKAPKDKHRLERAISKRIWKDKEGVIGIVAGVEGGHPEFYSNKGYYPASQEYGWEYPKGVFHPPHPYIRPAFDENKARMRNRLRDAYKRVIERAGR